MFIRNGLQRNQCKSRRYVIASVELFVELIVIVFLVTCKKEFWHLYLWGFFFFFFFFFQPLAL
jgi:hypothetical protein